MDFIFEIFRDTPRQGPGNNKTTAKAFSFIKNINSGSKILDIGCGSGIQTLKVAELSGAEIIAIDVYQPFLDDLEGKAVKAGVSNQIRCKIMSMDKIDYSDESFDLIWAEGSIFIIGFETGLKSWRRLIKENGFLVVSELAWLKMTDRQNWLNTGKK